MDTLPTDDSDSESYDYLFRQMDDAAADWTEETAS